MSYFTQEISDWKLQRLGKFTASECYKLFESSRSKGQLFGKGAMTYIRTKAGERLTMEIPEEIDFKQSTWGKANEPDAVMAYEAETGYEGIHYGTINPAFFAMNEYFGGSPDWESLDGKRGADMKCPFNSAEHVKNLELMSAEELEQERWEYYCQGQANMLIRKWEAFDFVSYDPRMVEMEYRLKIVTIYPDSNWISEFGERLAAAIKKVEEIIANLEGKTTVQNLAANIQLRKL